MYANMDMKSALEASLGDDSIRRLNFVIPFTRDSTAARCLALTAPGLSEVHPHLAVPDSSRGQKRRLDHGDIEPLPQAPAWERATKQ